MHEITSASLASSIADDCQTSYRLRLPLPTKFWGMNTIISSQSRWSSKRQRSWEFVRCRQDVPTSTMKEIFYVKANGWCGCVGFVFLSDGDSYIAKKSLSKINPIGSSFLMFGGFEVWVVRSLIRKNFLLKISDYGHPITTVIYALWNDCRLA